MAASFPNAKKTFSQVVNGVTKLVAALFNTPYDEIEAMQTYIGPTGGGAQAYSESLKGLLLNYRRGCSVDYKGVADLYVRAGELTISDASGNIRLRRNTADTTVDWGEIDTGSEANSTQYYVYAVADASATTFTVMISTNATTPTGATFYKRLGSFYNDASGNITLVTNQEKTNAIKAVGVTDIDAPASETDMDDMSITIITTGTKLLCMFSAPFYQSGGEEITILKLQIDGVEKCATKGNTSNSGGQTVLSINWLEIGLTPGSHTVKIRWNYSGGPAEQNGSTDGQRVLTVLDLQ